MTLDERSNKVIFLQWVNFKGNADFNIETMKVTECYLSYSRDC